MSFASVDGVEVARLEVAPSPEPVYAKTSKSDEAVLRPYQQLDEGAVTERDGQVRRRKVGYGMSNSADILMRCHVPGHEDVYALGAIDSRLTLYSQQVRAHNLAYAIREEYGSNHHVGIVGCGIGGMTLGALLALDGLHVHMFEQGPHPLHLYERAHHRWLHPRILDWPEFESLGDRAMLPVFDWVANDASAVVAVWNTELARAQADCHRATDQRQHIGALLRVIAVGSRLEYAGDSCSTSSC